MNHDKYNHIDISRSGSSGGDGVHQGGPPNYDNPSPMQLAQQPPPLDQRTSTGNGNHQPIQPQHSSQQQTHQYDQFNNYNFSQQQAQTSVPSTYTEPLPRPPDGIYQQQQHQAHYSQQTQYSQPPPIDRKPSEKQSQSQHQNQNQSQLQSQSLNQPVSRQMQYGQKTMQHQNQQARPSQYEQPSQQQMQHHNQQDHLLQYDQPSQQQMQHHNQQGQSLQYKQSSQHQMPHQNQNQQGQPLEYEQPSQQQMQHQNQQGQVLQHEQPSQQQMQHHNQQGQPLQYEQLSHQQMQHQNQQDHSLQYEQPLQQQIKHQNQEKEPQPFQYEQPSQQQMQHQNQHQQGQSLEYEQPSQQQMQHQNQDKESHPFQYEQPPQQQMQHQNQRSQPLQYEQPSHQQIQHQKQSSYHQVTHDRPATRTELSSTQTQYEDQQSYGIPQPRQVTHDGPASRNQPPPQNHKQMPQHQSQSYHHPNNPQQHSQQIYPLHQSQQPSQQPTKQIYDIQKTVPSHSNFYAGTPDDQTLPFNSTVTTAVAVFPKPNVTVGNAQICKPNESEERTPKQDYILLIRRFKRFLFNISNTVDTSWPVLEKHIQHTKINATEFLSNQKISTNLLGFHKFGINLISTRKAKIVDQKAKIGQIKTLEEIHHIYKIIFAEIYLLKQACEKGVKCYDDVLQVVPNAKLELQLKEMQLLFRNSSDFEKKMHETKEVLQKLFSDRNLVVPNEKNVTAKVGTQDSSGSNVGKLEVGKVKIGKQKKSATTSKKKNGSKSKSKECKSDEQDLSVRRGSSNTNLNASNSHGPIGHILDEFPDRLVNPLLELPQPSVVSERILPVSEYLKMMEVYFPEPDTFPLSYSAKLLGIDLPTSNNEGQKKGKSDPWMQIPPLGKYGIVNSIDNDAPQKDEDFDHIDPMWSSILNDYRGYKDDYLKQASEMNKPFYFCEDCVSFARDLGILGERIIFKVATIEDVPKLCVFSEINNVRIESSWFEQIIKSGNHFIISAISSDNEMIGYVHYQFCWFRPRCQNPLANEDVALERVVHIESIQLMDTISFEGSECLILLALVLEHARRHVVYGMMQLPVVVVPFLQQYFRMSVISSPSTEDALLACDLERCSFKYAFHALKDKKLARKEKKSQVQLYRLLVQLPTCRKVPIQKAQALCPDASTPNVDTPKIDVVPNTMNGSSTPNGTTKDTYRTDEQAKIKQAPACRIFTHGKRNPKDKNKSIVVSVSKDKVSVMKVPIDRSPNKKMLTKKVEKVQKVEKVLNQENWNTISLSQYSSKKKGSSAGTTNANAVLTSLKNLQGQLAALENRNRPVLEKIFTDVRDERLAFEVGDERKKRKEGTKMFARYEAELLRRVEAQKVVEAKQEEDDNAVCDICGDGESPGENRIIFCDSCDVSVHQHCYGVDTVPRGDYFCRACIHHKNYRQTPAESEPDAREQTMLKAPPIKCELCPKKHGAFVQTQTFSKNKEPPESKWVHFLCAKWQGLSIVEGVYVGGELVFMVEDVQPIKDHFRLNETKCYLCKGMRGAYNQCRHEGCERYIHVTCARSSGICEVNHGDDHIGPVDSSNVWTLCCPEHSTFSEDRTMPSNKVPREDLVALAKSFPVEAKPLPKPEPPKPFYKMSGKERKQKLKDPEYEEEFLGHLMRAIPGIRCEVCDLTDTKGQLMKCGTCSSVAHVTCCSHNPWKVVKGKDSSKYFCISCAHKEEHKIEELAGTSECHMCFTKHGTLVPCSAKPMSMKKWKTNIQQFEKSLFGRKIWCHPVCGMWHPKTFFDEDGVLNCTNIIMANGQRHIEGSQFCGLCGHKERVKVQCKFPMGPKKQCPERFHATCARQAGLEVSNDNPEVEMSLMCFNHGRCDFAFRALLEDMIEFEKVRAGNDLSRSGGSMKLECASNIFNSGIRVLRSLGWSWQWSKWWVKYGDNWEPLLEEGQSEASMTKEQLKIVESSPTSRRDDARKCRLAAFGAALRNRDYDKTPGDDRVPLHNALRAIFSISSLVGPLSKVEINFFVEWLGRIYRSKSPLLVLGDDKASVNEKNDRGSPVYFSEDSPKFQLGVRTLPGKHIRNGFVFESGVQEVDDYFKDESSILPVVVKARLQGVDEKVAAPIQSKKSKSKNNNGSSDSSSSTSKNLPISSKKPRSGKAAKTQKITKTKVTIVTVALEKSIPERKKPGRKRKGESMLAVKTPAAVMPEKVKPGRKKGIPWEDESAIVLNGVEAMNTNISRSRSGRITGRSSIADCELSNPIVQAAVVTDVCHKPKSGRKRGRPSLEDRIISKSARVIIDTDTTDSKKTEERSGNEDDQIPRKSSPNKERLSLDDPIPKKNRLEEPIPKRKRGRPKKNPDL